MATDILLQEDRLVLDANGGPIELRTPRIMVAPDLAIEIDDAHIRFLATTLGADRSAPPDVLAPNGQGHAIVDLVNEIQLLRAEVLVLKKVLYQGVLPALQRQAGGTP